MSTIKNKIYLLVDCDVDGMMSASIAYLYLTHIGILKQSIKVLHHTNKTHGLTNETMSQIDDDCKLIWIPDAGSNDVKQCKILHDRGIKILITDHHFSVPNPYAIVINNQLSPNVANKSLSGTGVTFKFIQYCCLQNNDKWYQSLLDLVAFANLGDVMSMLTLENRAFNVWGLSHINNPLLKAMCEQLVKDDITPTAIVWNCVPKLNSCFRSNNQELKQAIFDCIVGNRNDYDNIIDHCVKQHNKQKNIVSKIFNDIISKNEPTNDKVMIIKCDNTPYTGLVANKLMEHYSKPVLLVHNDNGEYIGSCRSQYDLRDKLKASGLMTICEGHNNVFGVGWLEKDIDKLQEYCNGLDLKDTSDKIVVQSFNANEHIPQYLFTFADEYAEIWGQGISKPQYYTYNIRINSKDIKQLGKNKTTIKFHYNDIDYIKFFISQADQESKWFMGQSKEINVELIGEFRVNEWNGTKYKQCIINDFEVNKVAKKTLDWSDIF